MPIQQNGQTHSNNSSATADEWFECVWPFCKVGVARVKFTVITIIVIFLILTLLQKSIPVLSLFLEMMMIIKMWFFAQHWLTNNKNGAVASKKILINKQSRNTLSVLPRNPLPGCVIWHLNKLLLYGAKYSRMEQVKFVEDSI